MRDLIVEFDVDVPRRLGLSAYDVETQLQCQLCAPVNIECDEYRQRVRIFSDWGLIQGRTDQMRVIRLKSMGSGETYSIALMPPMSLRPSAGLLPTHTAPAHTVAPTRSRKLLLT